MSLSDADLSMPRSLYRSSAHRIKGNRANRMAGSCQSIVKEPCQPLSHLRGVLVHGLCLAELDRRYSLATREMLGIIVKTCFGGE